MLGLKEASPFSGYGKQAMSIQDICPSSHSLFSFALSQPVSPGARSVPFAAPGNQPAQ